MAQMAKVAPLMRRVSCGLYNEEREEQVNNR
jgi:hypothetical protein